jgi:general secretion pathway protein C
MPRWILPLNIVLGVLVIGTMALITADLLSFKISTLYPRSAQNSAAEPPPATTAEDLLSFAPILEKGLFGKATQGKLTPIVQALPAQQQAMAAPAPVVTDLTLLGTAVGSFRETFALVHKGSSQEERVFRLGETVFSAGPLVSVKKDVAEILVGGKRVKILTPTAVAAEAAAQAAMPAHSAPAAGGLASPTGAGNYVVDQRALNAALDNIGQAMTDARLLPSIKDGKVEGFRASEVKPQGIFGTIGIRNGDVLLRMNDFPIDSPEKAIQSFASLKGQSKIKLDLIRDGQPTTFNYDIR